MITFKKADSRIVELDFEGEITGEDYKQVRPQIEAVMREKGKVKFLMDLTKAKGFSLGAMIQDIRFDIGHFKNIGATAVIASQKTYELATKAINAIYPEKVYHFGDQASALTWLKGQAA